jgi:hypothetical protein
MCFKNISEELMWLIWCNILIPLHILLSIEYNIFNVILTVYRDISVE